MPGSKQHITDLAWICRKKEVKKIVISPGSRSAPLIKTFVDIFGDDCISLVDERSAGFFALGLAVFYQKPVALICTSGTAVLNYAPAIAEAYYQNVPLIAITADRPHEWIDQQDNQTLRQKYIYQNYIKASIELPQYINQEDDLWFAHRSVNDALNICIRNPAGPVHINVPLTEPLYDELPSASDKIRIINDVAAGVLLKLPEALVDEWKRAKKIMILHGQDKPDADLSASVAPLLNDPRIIFIAENISNISGDELITNSNLILSLSRNNSPAYPDLILHSGGQIVSKALTGYLRRSEISKVWRIGNDYNLIDTFKLAVRFLPFSAANVYRALSEIAVTDKRNNYKKSWLTLVSNSVHTAVERMRYLPFSDVHIFKKVSELLPDDILLALGNSSVIRYSQLFPVKRRIKYYSNRGTSGIDGTVSTAAGICYASGMMTILIIGDLGLLYDSNGLWNRELPAKLRILVINNHGGGIFHIIKGPTEHPGFKRFIEANHPVNIAKLAEAYGIRYIYADDENTLINKWPEFIGEHPSAVIFEVSTDASTSASAFRSIMAVHKNNN